MANHLRLVLLAAALAAIVVAVGRLAGPNAALGGDAASKEAGKKLPTPAAAEEEDPLGANAACYVCHMTFVKEELAKVHLKEKIGCVKCHGLSEKHANDENIGATKPDIVFKRGQIDAACQKCHERHDVPAKNVVARAVERRLAATVVPVCTDCHGTHKIDRSAAKK